jgi:Protein of unknown function VcgC/VcgE (DUF2780).
MDDLINRIAANVGIEPDTARKAVGVILAFLQSEGPADKVKEMLTAFPGAEALIAEAGNGGGGLLGGLLGGGVMGLGSKLMGMGLGMGEISGVAKETVGYAREQGKGKEIDEIVASIPGLGQFV